MSQVTGFARVKYAQECLRCVALVGIMADQSSFSFPVEFDDKLRPVVEQLGVLAFELRNVGATGYFLARGEALRHLLIAHDGPDAELALQQLIVRAAYECGRYYKAYHAVIERTLTRAVSGGIDD